MYEIGMKVQMLLAKTWGDLDGFQSNKSEFDQNQSSKIYLFKTVTVRVYLIVAIPITLRLCSSISKQSTKNLPRSNFEMERPGDLS